MENKIREVIYNVSNILKSSFPYEEYNSICIYCVFVKFILDNKKLLLNENSFATILDLQRMFDRKELNEKALIDVSIAIEGEYHLPHNSLVDFAQTYIRFNNIQKSYDVSAKVLQELNETSFEDNGEEIVEVLKETLYSAAASFGRLMSDKISAPSLSKIVGALLEVKDGDSYADLAYGMGASTLEITENKDCSITGYEINRSSIAIAEMLLIMSGKEHFNLNICNILECDIAENSFDKIATMPPIGYKIRENDYQYQAILESFNLPYKTFNFETFIILKSILALKNNGTAIITVTPNFLFSNTVIESQVRQLITKKHLQAVIQLPSLYYGTGIQTVILILKKEKESSKMTFIDASTNDYFNFSDKSNRTSTLLTVEGIDKIKEIFLKQETIEGISYCASADKIADSEYLLTPARYIEVKSNREVVSNAEIDLKLKKLYEEVRSFMEE